VGLNVAEQYLDKSDSKIPLLLASTAHWSKFPSCIDKSIFNNRLSKDS